MTLIASVVPLVSLVDRLLAGTPLTAVPSPTPTPDAAPVTGPGVVGFLVTFALVVACIPLFLSMTRKIRGVRYRDEQASAEGPADGDAGAPGPRP